MRHPFDPFAKGGMLFLWEEFFFNTGVGLAAGKFYNMATSSSKKEAI